MRSFLTFALTISLAVPLHAGNSNSLLDVSPDGSRLLVANTDSGTVTVVDLKSRKSLGEIPVGDHPEGVTWIGNGPLALATVYGDDKVLFLDVDQKKVVHERKVADEPYGLVATRDGKTVFVTHDYPGSVSVIDVNSKKVIRTHTLGQGLRGIALSNDEKTLYVSEFFTGTLIGMDTATGRIIDRWEGHPNDNLARSVVLHPSRPKAYLAHIRSRVNHFDARGSIFPHISFCDLDKPADAKRRRSLALDSYQGLYIVTNPWEVAFSPDGKTIYSIYAGTDDMNVSRVLDDNYQEMEPIGRARRIGKHARAIRVHPTGSEVYVYNTLDYSVSVHDADFNRKLADIPVCKPPLTPEWRRGKELFQTAEQPMGSARWIACSSCHPDGLTDFRVWQNPEGHRKTPNLFGLAHTHPLHWSADRDESQDFEFTVRGKLMQGRGLARDLRLPAAKGFSHLVGLETKTSNKSADLDAMAIYTNSFPIRLSPHIPEPGKLHPEAERGKSIFYSAETKCATCHSGPYYSDSRLEKPYNLHDVGTGTGTDEKMGPKYDTPTLLGVYRVGMWLHDGRAKTLHDVFTTHNKKDQHGKTSHLTPQQVDDLVAFVKSLPYEPPPLQTPNTVPFFVKQKH